MNNALLLVPHSEDDGFLVYSFVGSFIHSHYHFLGTPLAVYSQYHTVFFKSSFMIIYPSSHL